MCRTAQCDHRVLIATDAGCQVNGPHETDNLGRSQNARAKTALRIIRDRSRLKNHLANGEEETEHLKI